MNLGIHTEGKDIYLSYSFLKKSGISTKTIEYWDATEIGYRLKIEGHTHILFSSIPDRSQKKLPNEKGLLAILKKEQGSRSVEALYQKINEAYYKSFANHLPYYQKDNTLPANQALKFSRMHSVFDCLLAIQSQPGFRDLLGLYEAFNRVLPGKYKSKHALSNAINKAKCDGVFSVAFDKRALGNNNEGSAEKIKMEVKDFIKILFASAEKLSNSAILQRVIIFCKEFGYQVPSLSTVKAITGALRRDPAAKEKRYGSQYTNRSMPFASLLGATHSGQQFQMDGKHMPFWGPAFARYKLIMVIDNHSRKIVGCAFGNEENSSSIMDAIRDAVGKTGILPMEWVTDNHAFNQTGEAENLKRMCAERGSVWTVSQNPQYKAIIERHNQHIDNLCSSEYGYLGAGVKSKSPDDVISPEQAAEYRKNFRSREEIKAIAFAAVEKWNNTPRKDGKTPNEKYEQGLPPNPLRLDIYARAEITTNHTHKQIRNGQIVIMRGSVKNEFQITDPQTYLDYNDKKVLVRYDALEDGIYLFDVKTNNPICHLPPKAKAQGAKACQTNIDLKIIGNTSNLNKDIRALSRAKLEAAKNNVYKDPDAHERLNSMVVSKSLLDGLEKDANQRQYLEEQGVDLSLLPAQPGKTKNLFRPRNHKTELFNPNDNINQDQY